MRLINETVIYRRKPRGSELLEVANHPSSTTETGGIYGVSGISLRAPKFGRIDE